MSNHLEIFLLSDVAFQGNGCPIEKLTSRKAMALYQNSEIESGEVFVVNMPFYCMLILSQIGFILHPISTKIGWLSYQFW